MQIKRGDCLLISKPFTYVLSSKQKENRCDNCLKSSKLLKCSGCQYVYYCDRSCQKESWSIHKAECANLKRISPKVVPDAARLLGRIIIKLQNGGDNERDYYNKDDISFRRFKDMMSHYTDVKNDSSRMEHFVSLCKVLEEYLIDVELPNTAEILGIYSRICINSFSIMDNDMNSIGSGIYLAPSIIDHSCKPNAVAVFEGTTIMIRAIEDIPRFDWSQIHISYIDFMNTTNARRAELQKTYYFLCECEKCHGPEIFASAAQCQTCGSPCDIEENTCLECGLTIPASFKEKVREVVEFTTKQFEEMKNRAYLDISKKCLEKQEGILHHLNIQHVRTIESAFDAAVDIGFWEEAESFGLRLVPGYLQYYGEIHPTTGILHLMLGKIQLHLNKPKLALEVLSRADKIFKITHGEKHSIFLENLNSLMCQAVMENQQKRKH